MPSQGSQRRNRGHRRQRTPTSDSGEAGRFPRASSNCGEDDGRNRHSRDSGDVGRGTTEGLAMEESCPLECSIRNSEVCGKEVLVSRDTDVAVNAWISPTSGAGGTDSDECSTKHDGIGSARSERPEGACAEVGSRVCESVPPGSHRGAMSSSSHCVHASDIGPDGGAAGAVRRSRGSIVPTPLPPIEGPIQLAWPPGEQPGGSAVVGSGGQHNVFLAPEGSLANPCRNTQQDVLGPHWMDIRDDPGSSELTSTTTDDSNGYAGISGAEGGGVPQWSNPNQTPNDGVLRTYQDVGSIYSETPADRVRNNPPCASCCVDRSNPDSWRYNRPRSHAFQWPLHSLQIMAIITIMTCTVLFVSSLVPAYVLLYREGGFTDCLWEVIVSSTVVVGSIVCTFVFMFIIAFRENGDVGDEGEPCAFCERRTLLNSRHCKACNKCIEGFDHHCKWLNMCIGSKNYRLFISFVVSALCSMVLGLVGCIVFLAKWWAQLQSYSTYFRVGPVIFCVLVFLMSLPLVHLLGFHIMLHYTNMTTYEYIMNNRLPIQPRQGNVLPSQEMKELQQF